MLGGCATATGSGPLLGFKSIPVTDKDTLVVPEGYAAVAIAAWGEPVGVPGNMPAWRATPATAPPTRRCRWACTTTASTSTPLDGSSTRGLLVMNHEYTDDGLLHPDGMKTWSAEKVRKAQAAHGVSVIEVELKDGRWQMVRPSRYARRFTANTPLRRRRAGRRPCADEDRRRPGRRARVLGTLNNCASGMTPWGTYLSGEENFAFYFDGRRQPDADQPRWGMRKTQLLPLARARRALRRAAKHPNEFNRFGWVVEIDPIDPTSTPVKRTALGRAAHEGAWVAVTKDGRAVVYSGEDARFEYIYKFVSRDKIAPGGAKANADAARPRHAVRGALRRRRHAATGCRWCTARGR